MPPALGSVALELQVASSEETSKFAGAVAVILPVKADPVTVTEVEVEAEPVKELRLLEVPAIIVGVEADDVVKFPVSSVILWTTPTALYS
jgi:hypothetical protein